MTDPALKCYLSQEIMHLHTMTTAATTTTNNNKTTTIALSGRYCAKHVIYINSFNPYNNFNIPIL